VTKPLIPWPGGKRRWADKLLPLFPQHKTYVEAFAGAAGLFFVRPEPAPVEVLNDINGDLVNLYRVVQHHLDEFVRQFRWALVSRQDFLWKRLQHPEPLTDIQRAARFYYLQKTAFGGKVVGQSFGTSTTAPPRLNLVRIEEDLSGAHLRLAKAVIEHLPWADCLARYDRPETLFFLDPPYWQVEGYGVPFDLDQYVALAEAMRGLKGKAVLTINDHPDMRRAFAGFKPLSTAVRYTIGKPGKARSTPRGELIYRSWIS
jgi:DNA adenine methylase